MSRSTWKHSGGSVSRCSMFTPHPLKHSNLSQLRHSHFEAISLGFCSLLPTLESKMPHSSLFFCLSFPLPLSPNSPSCTVCQPSVHLRPPKRLRPVAALEGDSSEKAPEFPNEPIQYFNPAKPPSHDPPSLSELPLFPLQMVLNPGTAVPLHIFELRYRLLFNRIRDSDGRFGIVLYNPDSSDLALIGCAAELTRFEPLPDGRIVTNNVGRQRFRIVRIMDDKPYTRAMVQFLSDEPPEQNLKQLMKDVWQTLEDVLRLSNKLYDKTLDLGSDLRRLAPLDGRDLGNDGSLPEGWPSPTWVEEFSFAVNQVLDMPLAEQQILLQMRDTDARLRRQNKRLQVARQYLAAQVTIKEAGLGKW